jgi:hypothetical protein
MLAKDDWHLSCCCLNLERLSLRSIWKTQHVFSNSYINKHKQ